MKVCTMCTPWATDSVVLVPDRAGFRIFPRNPVLAGLECHSSSTSGTKFSLVRGDFALTC